MQETFIAGKRMEPYKNKNNASEGEETGVNDLNEDDRTEIRKTVGKRE